MTGTPRLLNRILLGILGFKLLVIGVLLMLLAAVPAVAAWWHSWSKGVSENVTGVFEGTQFPGRQGSWLWIVLALAVVLLIGLMVAWIAQQGKGRTDLLLAAEDPGGVPGDIRIERPEFAFYFPITTMLLVSAAATGIFYLAGRLRR